MLHPRGASTVSRVSSDTHSRTMVALRHFAHWFAHLLDDREPSRRSDLVIRGPDGEVKVILSNHDGSAGH